MKKEINSIGLVLPGELAEITMSDNLNYWHFGFNAIMVTNTAFFRNKNYHIANDTFDTIDFEKMQYSVDMIVKSIITLNATV